MDSIPFSRLWPPFTMHMDDIDMMVIFFIHQIVFFTQSGGLLYTRSSSGWVLIYPKCCRGEKARPITPQFHFLKWFSHVYTPLPWNWRSAFVLTVKCLVRYEYISRILQRQQCPNHTFNLWRVSSGFSDPKTCQWAKIMIFQHLSMWFQWSRNRSVYRIDYCH